MRTAFVSNSANMTGAPRMLKVFSDSLEGIGWLKDSEAIFVAPVDSYSDRKDPRWHLFNDRGLTLPERVALAKQVIDGIDVQCVVANTVRMAYFAIAAKELGIGSVLYIHEMSSNQLAAILGGYACIDIEEYCDQILWASEQCREDWSKITAHESSGIVLEPCFIPAPKVKDGRVDRIVDGLKDARFSVVSIGTASMRKGFDRFVELAAAFPEIPFTWVGGFDRNGPEEEKALREAMSDAENVTVTGQIRNPSAILLNSGLCVFLSREDPNPLTIMEAVHHGVDFIAAVDGLGSKNLPRLAGAAIESYDYELFCEVIQNALDASPENEYAAAREKFARSRSESFAGLVRQEEDFAADVQSTKELEDIFLNA